LIFLDTLNELILELINREFLPSGENGMIPGRKGDSCPRINVIIFASALALFAKGVPQINPSLSVCHGELATAIIDRVREEALLHPSDDTRTTKEKELVYISIKK
jgi:hypothetical protein